MILFTYPWLFKVFLGDHKRVLDLGCGDGAFMKIVNHDNFYNVTGVELFSPYIRKAKATKAYSKIIKQDLRLYKPKIKYFDAAISSQVIEHLTKKEGKLHIKTLEKAASHVIIGTPNGHFHQEEYDHNKLQEHHSEWTVADFRDFGYQVYGQGLKFVYGEKGLLNSQLGKMMIFKIVFYGLSFLSSPVVYFRPEWAAHIIAVKHD